MGRHSLTCLGDEMKWRRLFLAAICLDVLCLSFLFSSLHLCVSFTLSDIYLYSPALHKRVSAHRTEGSLHPRVDEWTNLNQGNPIWFDLLWFACKVFPYFVISSPDQWVDWLSTHPTGERPRQYENVYFWRPHSSSAFPRSMPHLP